MRNHPVGLGRDRGVWRRLRPARATLAVAAMAALGAAGLSAGAPVAQAAACTNAQYRVGPSLSLPDCRAYEQVTPAQKNGNATQSVKTHPSAPLPAWASADGDTLLYQPVGGPTAANAAAGYTFPEVATRSGDGWDGRPAANGPAPQALIDANTTAARYVVPSADRGSVMFISGSPWVADQSFVAATGNGGAYLGRGSRMDWLSRPTSPNASPVDGTHAQQFSNFLTVGGSPDLSTAYFMSLATLTPMDDTSGRAPMSIWATYRWTNGTLVNAAVLPNGTLDPDGSVVAGLSPGMTGSGSGSLWNSGMMSQTSYAHSVSADGNGLLFVSPAPGASTTRPPELYLARVGQQTVRLSQWSGTGTAPTGGSDAGVAQTGALEGNRSQINDGTSADDVGVYAVATPDQRVVLFSTTDALTDDASTDASTMKTYRWAAAGGGSLTHIAEMDRPTTKGSYVSPYPIYNMSDDGSRILYMDYDGNLKLWRQGASTITLATGLEGGTASINESRFSTDGRTLVLMSRVPLQGAAGHPAGNTAQQNEIYRYTESDDKLTCVTCAVGITVGPATFDTVGFDSGFGWGDATGLTSRRGISDDGTRVFFTTTTAFSPDDHNAVADVYEWEGGQIHLLSSGATNSRGDYLLDNSASGDDVFINSDQQLAPTDTDDTYDVYDVRVGGGLPVPVAPRACAGDACQGPAPAAPGGFGTPASLTFVGEGNVAPATHASQRAKPRLHVARVRAVRGAAARILVRVSGKGRIRTSGAALRRSSRAVPKAGTYRVTVRLNKRARTRHRAGHRVRVRVTVRFTSATGRSVTVHRRVTFRAGATAHRRAAASARTARRATAVLSSELRKGR